MHLAVKDHVLYPVAQLVVENVESAQTSLLTNDDASPYDTGSLYYHAAARDQNIIEGRDRTRVPCERRSNRR